MQLVLAIIQDADASALMRALREHAFNVTKLASSGGFLREGNTTLMIGLSADRLANLKTVVRQCIRWCNPASGAGVIRHPPLV